jgi:phospholipid transport system substrate-binding protein
MLSRRLFITFTSAFLSSSIIIPVAAFVNKSTEYTETGAKIFIGKLAEEALISLTKSELSIVERRGLFRDLMRRYFAFNVIAKWVLGRYWKRATDFEKDEYLTLFEMLVHAAEVELGAQVTLARGAHIELCRLFLVLR